MHEAGLGEQDVDDYCVVLQREGDVSLWHGFSEMMHVLSDHKSDLC